MSGIKKHALVTPIRIVHGPCLYLLSKWVIFNYQWPSGWIAWLVHSVNSPLCKDSWLIKCCSSLATTVTCIVLVHRRRGPAMGTLHYHDIWGQIYCTVSEMGSMRSCQWIRPNTCKAVKKISSLWMWVKKRRDLNEAESKMEPKSLANNMEICLT